GWIEIAVNGEKKTIGIERIHLEEDAGNLTHGADRSLVDYNRKVPPLMEKVSETDIRSPEEAYTYVEKLKSSIQYTGVSNVRMEERLLRCDANISLRPVRQEAIGTKTELKNLNSFAYVKSGLEHEVARQTEILSDGGTIEQETRRYD